MKSINDLATLYKGITPVAFQVHLVCNYCDQNSNVLRFLKSDYLFFLIKKIIWSLIIIEKLNDKYERS